MKRTGWLAVGLCMAALSLPGCGAAPRPAADASRPASTTPKDLQTAAGEQERRRGSTEETESILAQEEGHPFWNVVGATLGLAGAVLVVALMLGGV